MSEEEITTKQVADELFKFKLSTYDKINELGTMQQNYRAELDLFEATVSDLKSQLKKQEVQRKDATATITGRIDDIEAFFKKHDEKEMKKYDLIVDSINALTESLKSVRHETDDNSKTLMQKRIEEEKQRAIDEALAKQNEPLREIKKKAVMTLVGVVTVAISAGTWQLIVFVADIDKMVTGG